MPASPIRHKPPSNLHPQPLVDALVRKYQQTEPSPVLLELLHKPDQYALLVNGLYRQISLIKRRSQSFEDGQVTIYDRALLVLSTEGYYPIQTGVIELYLTEFLGLDPTYSAQDAKDAMVKHVELQNILDMSGREFNPYTTTALTRSHQEPTSPRMKCEESSKFRPSPTTSTTPITPITTTNTITNDNHLYERVNRMLNVYHRAKEDYHRIKRRDNVEPLDAVRFLRDTAENTILYLRTNGLSDHELIPELEKTFDYAKHKAAVLSGGRKRHFDDDRDWRRREGERERERRGQSREKRSRSGRVIDSYRPGSN